MAEDENWENYVKKLTPLYSKKKVDVPKINFSEINKEPYKITYIKNSNYHNSQQNNSFNINSSRKFYKKLKKRQLKFDDILDLHGYNIKEASLAIDSFIENNYWNNKKLLLIITGKGSAEKDSPLREMLPERLKQMTSVLDYLDAPQELGGSGAKVVILKS